MANEVIVICTGPTADQLSLLATIQADVLIGVDNGAALLAEAGYLMTYAIGDFDSITSEQLAQVVAHADKLITLPQEKDDTDTEAALQLVVAHYPACQEIIVLGALTGARLDHLWSVLYLAHQARFAHIIDKLVFKNTQNTVRFYRQGTHQLFAEADRSYVSVICMTAVDALTLEGLQYPLVAADIPAPQAFVSNTFINNKASITFTRGLIAVVQARDGDC